MIEDQLYSCQYNSKEYRHETTFSRDDQVCSCNKGKITCVDATTNPKNCNYNGQTYTVGEQFDSTDGCNTCSCTENGEVLCTEMWCEDDGQASESCLPDCSEEEIQAIFDLNGTYTNYKAVFSTGFDSYSKLETDYYSLDNYQYELVEETAYPEYTGLMVRVVGGTPYHKEAGKNWQKGYFNPNGNSELYAGEFGSLNKFGNIKISTTVSKDQNNRAYKDYINYTPKNLDISIPDEAELYVIRITASPTVEDASYCFSENKDYIFSQMQILGGEGVCSTNYWAFDQNMRIIEQGGIGFESFQKTVYSNFGQISEFKKPI